MAQDTAGPQPSRLVRYTGAVADELGLTSLYNFSRDTKLLCLQRFVRLFAYGGSTLVLAPYLEQLGTSYELIGTFMTLTLFGDTLISFLLTLTADGLGRRRVLALGALLMSFSGIVFALVGNYWALLAAAIVGVITPSGNEIGPFRAIEESTLAHLSSLEHRPKIFAWYNLIGTGGGALGLLVGGWTTTTLMRDHAFDAIKAYRVIFFAYAALGLVKLLLALLLSRECELDQPASIPIVNGETAPLLSENGNAPAKTKPASKFVLLPKLSAESKTILVQLCVLFALDSFASGLAPMSWLTFYFQRRFGIDQARVGTLFFGTSIVQAASNLAAASIATRFGNVKTMVFTHLPSSVCLALVGIPSSLPLAMALLILRASTQSMDSAPRSAFLSAVVLAHERTAVMGTINVVKTVSQSVGPVITGVLVGKQLFWVAFLAAGTLKAVYDIGVLLVFAGHKTREEQARDEDADDGTAEPAG